MLPSHDISSRASSHDHTVGDFQSDWRKCDLIKKAHVSANTENFCCTQEKPLVPRVGPHDQFQRNYIIARNHKSDLHDMSFQSSPKINDILNNRKTHFHTMKVYNTPDHPSFAN